MKLTSAAAVVCLLLAFAQAEDTKREEADQLLRAAFESSCSTTNVAPYEVIASVEFDQLSTGKAYGSYRKQWADHKNFIQEVRMEDYQLVTATKDGKQYRHENSDFTPLSVSQFLRMVPPFCIRLDDTDIVRKISNRRINGTQVRCIAYDTVRGALSKAHEACVQLTQPGAPPQTVLLSYKENNLEFRWTEYTAFGRRVLPKRVHMMRNDTKLIEGVFKYASQDLSPTPIALPDGMKEMPSCQRRVPPVVKSSPDPSFPREGPRVFHQVVVEVIVGTEGTVKEARLLETGTKSFDDEAIRAVKTWTFLPALCDGTPQEAHVQVQVNFSAR